MSVLQDNKATRMTGSSQNKLSAGFQPIFATWWPLAGSWVLMGVELPLLSAVIARLADPKIHLAAFGGVVFPLSLLIEAPIIMLLAASTALSKNWASYVLLRRLMSQSAAVLTAIHVLIAFTPLYDVLVSTLLAVPEKIIEPARIGLQLMTPWTAAIAIRRFQQGVLIRFGQSKVVVMGTAVRLATNVFFLTAGYYAGKFPGIVVATSALAAGVTAEAIMVNVRIQPLLREIHRNESPDDTCLSMRQLLVFYLPLALTPILTLLSLPIGSAALSRMPHALESLAVLPVVMGLSFLIRSPGLAYHEVVVTLIGQPGAAHSLRRFTVLLATVTSSLLLVITITPLAPLWFGKVSGLSPTLTSIATTGLWFAVLMPALTALESWYQGVMVYSGRTGSIAQSVAVYLLISSVILGLGIVHGQVTGLYISLTATLIGFFMQTLWLHVQSQPTLRRLFTTPTAAT